VWKAGLADSSTTRKSQAKLAASSTTRKSSFETTSGKERINEVNVFSSLPGFQPLSYFVFMRWAANPKSGFVARDSQKIAVFCQLLTGRDTQDFGRSWENAKPGWFPLVEL
jgi:hypothetical protein